MYSLISLPDISNWDTSNVKNMSYLFNRCFSLISLPDISKWNTSNVMYMNCMFSFCKSLKSLPDISKWNTSNVKDMSYMFYECKLLSPLINILKWNISNVKNMNYMLRGCKSSFRFLPDSKILNKYKNNIIFELTYKNTDNIKYKVNILGKKFIEKNKDKGSIIYNSYEYELKEYFEDIDNNNHNDKIKFLLCLDKSINDISYLFYV